MALCCFVLWAGLEGGLAASITCILFALFRSLYGGLGSAAPPAVQAYVAARTDPEQRTQALSLVSYSVIGPAIAPFFILPSVRLAGPPPVFSPIGHAGFLPTFGRAAAWERGCQSDEIVGVGA